MRRTIRNKKGQTRVVEAMIACMLLIAAIGASTNISRLNIVANTSDLEEVKENILSVLCGPEVIRRILEGDEYSDPQLKTLIMTLLPPGTVFEASMESSMTGETIWNASNIVADPYSRYDYVAGMRTVTISLLVSQIEYREIDVMLVMDRSGSMNDPGNETHSKIALAKDAAKLFVDQLDMSEDRVGLASFSTEATLDCHLTNDSAGVKLAIGGLNAGGWTNIGGGINKSNIEFLGNGRTNASWIMILLSDGLANRYYDDSGQLKTDEEGARNYALKQADTAKALAGKGVRIYTIGLGLPPDLDENLLKQIASDETQYYHAPTAKELEAIYLAIAKDLLYQVKCYVIVVQLGLSRGG